MATDTPPSGKGGRTWNTPNREPWNPIIKHCLNGIDLHVHLYLDTGNPQHLKQADLLRVYVRELKEMILRAEGKSL